MVRKVPDHSLYNLLSMGLKTDKLLFFTFVPFVIDVLAGGQIQGPGNQPDDQVSKFFTFYFIGLIQNFLLNKIFNFQNL